jgi:hypothetical protein
MSNLYIFNGKEWEELAKNGQDAVVDYDRILLDVLSQIPKPKDGRDGKDYDSEKLNKTLSSIPTEDDLKQYIDLEISNSFKNNINILGMPDFRKLAMGLQQEIDNLRSQVNAIDITPGAGTSILTYTGTVDGDNSSFNASAEVKFAILDGGRTLTKTSANGNTNWSGTSNITFLLDRPTFDLILLG